MKRALTSIAMIATAIMVFAGVSNAAGPDGTAAQVAYGCHYGGWGTGSIFSIIGGLLMMALMAGLVVLVYLLIYNQWKKGK